MNFFNDRGFCEHKVFVAALGGFSTIILCSELIALYIRSHGTVINDDALRQGFEKFAHEPSNPPLSLEICIYFARAATSSRQKSGISSTTLPHTIFPSRNAASLTQIPPALVISSLMPTEPTALRPSIMPAEIGTQPPWQIVAMILFCLSISRTSWRIFWLRRNLS